MRLAGQARFDKSEPVDLDGECCLLSAQTGTVGVRANALLRAAAPPERR